MGVGIALPYLDLMSQVYRIELLEQAACHVKPW
jgi:hypothetical protein